MTSESSMTVLFLAVDSMPLDFDSDEKFTVFKNSNKTRWSSCWAKFPPEERKRCNPQYHKNDAKRRNIQCEISVEHVQFFKSVLGWPEVTIRLETLQLGAVETVCGQSRSLKSVSDVWQVRDPPQVHGYWIKRYKESGEEQEWYRHDRRQEHSVLK